MSIEYYGKTFLCEGSDITKAEFEAAPDELIFEFAVYRECLIYLFKMNGHLKAGVLRSYSTVIRDTDVLFISEGVYESPRKATEEDFDYFRVSSKGHLNNPDSITHWKRPVPCDCTD